MTKWIRTAIMLLPLLFATGCSQISDLVQGVTGGSSSGEPEMLRQATIAGDWHVKQMEIEVEAGGEVAILLRLADGDQVDGYFYLEKGKDIDFAVSGDSLIYQSESADPEGSGKVGSDRFSFTASQAQGSTYSLTFRDSPETGASQATAVVFLEVIYPSSGSLFIPVDTQQPG